MLLSLVAEKKREPGRQLENKAGQLTLRIQERRLFSMGESNYCGCCGHESTAGEWCKRCAKHVDPKKTLWDATYLAQFGVDCPYQNQAKNFAPANASTREGYNGN